MKRTIMLSLAALFLCIGVNAATADRYHDYDDNDGYDESDGYDDYDRHDSYDRDEYNRDRRELDRERERLDEERDRLREERRRLEREEERPTPDSCPSGFHPGNHRCSNEDRKRGCKDMRRPSGLTCNAGPFS